MAFKKLKNFFVCFMLIFSSLFFFGCSKVKLSTTLSSNGKITTSFELNLEDVSKQKTTIYQIFKEYLSQLDRAYEDNLIYYFSQVYEDFFDALDRQAQLEFITNNNLYYLAGKTEEFLIKDKDNNVKYIYLSKDFTSIYAYLMYFCPNAFSYNEENNKIQISSEYHSLIDVPMASNNGDIEESGNIFVNKYIQEFCPFFYNNEEPKFLYDNTFFSISVSRGDKLQDVIKESCGFSEEEVEYFFSFTTPYKRLHSSGEISTSNLGYTHTWALGAIDSKVEVWRNYANYISWYGFAIVVGVTGLIISFIVLKTTNKVKRKKGLKLLEKINNFENNKK